MVGKNKKRGHRSSYQLLLLHLLKWQFQRERRSRSWQKTIERERENILEYERQGRGRRVTAEDIDLLYQSARRLASRETGLPLDTFRPTCPYSIDFLRDRDAMPD